MPNVASKTSNVHGLEVFRAGKYPHGDFTTEDLKAIANTYNANLHAAPFTIDHKNEGQAYGWVNRAFVNADGSSLFVDAYFTDEMIEAVKAGKFLKRSVEIAKPFEETGKPYLLAVTMLGAKEPAVKGMSDAALSFTAKRPNVFAFTIQSAKDQPPMNLDYEKLGGAIAAAIKAAMDTPADAPPVADAKPDAVAAACDKDKMAAAPDVPAKPDDQPKDMAAAPGAGPVADPRDAKIAELQAQVQQLQGELVKTGEAAAEQADMSKFAAEWNAAVKVGKVTPGEEARARALFAAIPRDAVSTEKDANGKAIRTRDAYLQFSIAGRPVHPALATTGLGAATSQTSFVAPPTPNGDGLTANGTSVEGDRLKFEAQRIEAEHAKAGTPIDVSTAYRMASAKLKGATN